MLLAAQCLTGIAMEGPIIASEIKAITASHPPYNSVVNRLDFAAFSDHEPESSNVSNSGFGSVSGSNTSITMEFLRPLSVVAVMVQTLKAATAGSWGLNYMGGAKVQALVGTVWETVFTYPSGLSGSGALAPDGKTYNEKWPNKIPVGRVCSAIRLLKPSGYVCASTFIPIIG